jgi:hypothetical protein
LEFDAWNLGFPRFRERLQESFVLKFHMRGCGFTANPLANCLTGPPAIRQAGLNRLLNETLFTDFILPILSENL